MARYGGDDLRLAATLDYSDAETAYATVVSTIHEARAWYLRRKRSKRLTARTIRFSSLSLGLVGAILPLLSLSVNSIDAYAGYPLLAAAGGLQLFDQFFGTSESWARYMLAATTLGQLQAELSLKFAHAGKLGASELAKYAIVEEYDSKAWAILTTETKNWEALHSTLTNATRNHFTTNERANVERGANNVAQQN